MKKFKRLVKNESGYPIVIYGQRIELGEEKEVEVSEETIENFKNSGITFGEIKKKIESKKKKGKVIKNDNA